MLYTKFQGHRPFGSGEEDIFRFLPHMGMAARSCDLGRLNKLSFPYPMKSPYEIWLQSAHCFLRRRCLKSVDDGQTTDGQTDDGGLPIL